MTSKWFAGIVIVLLLVGLWPAGSSSESRLPPPDYPLLEAVKKNDVDAVRAILGAFASHSEINRRGVTGDLPLVRAARNGNLEIVRLLIERGATVDIGKENGDRTPLLEAAGQGHVDVVKFLLSKGADVNARGKGLTPLLLACAWGQLPAGPPGDKTTTIHILLENGADVNAQDESWLKTGRTPLMYAVMQGNAALVQTLLGKGARLDLKNKDGDTALSLAKKDGLEYIAQLLEKHAGSANESAGQADPDKVKALISKGADVNLRTPTGSTPLMYAADGNKLEIIRALLRSGADVNAKNGANSTALIFASVKGHLGVAKELLRRKADVNVKNIGGADALIYAVVNKKAKAVEALLAHGANVTDTYDEGKTALLKAANDGSNDIAGLLIACKADVNAADNNEMTALMIASEKGNAALVEMLLKAGADISKKSKYGDTALSKAIQGHHVPIVKKLIKSGWKYDRRDALSSAVIAGDPEIVKLLLTKDTDVNARGFAGGTLLMLAADGDSSLVKFLVERGADVNLKDDEGTTALMKAVTSYHKTNTAAMKYLIDRGADVNDSNNKGETALILAVKKGNPEMVKILVEKGSAFALKDKAGKSAWTYAVEGDHPEIFGLLEKMGALRDYSGMEWKGNVSNQKEPFIKVVDTRKEWSELWRRAFDKPAPDMDFEKYVVACVFLGYSADWLYSISMGKPVLRDNQLVVEYALIEMILRLSGPFKAGGQYHMQVLEKVKNVKMVLEEAGPTSRRR